MAKSLLCMAMSGPLLTGYTQTINDYYDREIDAINEPNRPIPSGDTEAVSVWTVLLLQQHLKMPDIAMAAVPGGTILKNLRGQQAHSLR